MFLSIVIPAYNEEKRIGKTLFSVSDYLKKQNYLYEIIVVNDGSKDRTVEVIKNLQPSIPNLKLIDNKKNCGKGSVVRQGLLEASGQYRLFTDADNSTSIEQIEKFLPYFQEGYDIIIASRDIKGAVLDPPQPFYRRFIGNIFNLMVQVILGLWGIRDTQCGFKALNKKAAEDILPRCKIKRWAFDPEILIVGKKMGYRIKEAPVVWKNDPESKVKFKGMVKMGIDLLRIRWNLMTGKYMIK